LLDVVAGARFGNYVPPSPAGRGGPEAGSRLAATPPATANSRPKKVIGVCGSLPIPAQGRPARRGHTAAARARTAGSKTRDRPLRAAPEGHDANRPGLTRRAVLHSAASQRKRGPLSTHCRPLFVQEYKNPADSVSKRTARPGFAFGKLILQPTSSAGSGIRPPTGRPNAPPLTRRWHLRSPCTDSHT